MSGASTRLAMSLIGPDYRFERQLGIGGNGVVILARHDTLDRLVAVKTILTAAADGPAHARLRREGRTLAALGHPNILDVYRMIDDQDAVALITEYVSGGDLDHALRRTTLPGSRLTEMLCQVASALVAAHTVGIVHRDIKPANILLDGTTRAVVADFGLARLRGEFRTEDGLVTGTPLYMSPEQIDDPGNERPSMDVYSYAVMTYRALTGRPPFVASSLAELVHAHRHAHPEPLLSVRPGLPPPVSDVVTAALAKNPADRAGLDDIATALRAVDPVEWDHLLPEVAAATDTRATSARKPREGSHTTTIPSATHTNISEGTGTEHGDAVSTTCGPDSAPSPVSPSVFPTVVIEPTIYEPHTAPPPQRWRIRLLAASAGILVGILIGLIALVVLL